MRLINILTCNLVMTLVRQNPARISVISLWKIKLTGILHEDSFPSLGKQSVPPLQTVVECCRRKLLLFMWDSIECVCVCVCACKTQTFNVKPIGMYTNHLVLKAWINDWNFRFITSHSFIPPVLFWVLSSFT